MSKLVDAATLIRLGIIAFSRSALGTSMWCYSKLQFQNWPLCLQQISNKKQ